MNRWHYSIHAILAAATTHSHPQFAVSLPTKNRLRRCALWAIISSMMLRVRKHLLLALTPACLARAFAWPFVIVVGGATAMLALAAASVGLNPVTFAGNFLTAAAVDVSPLATRLLAIWVIYTTIYLLLAWDVRFYAPRPNAGVNPALGVFAGHWLRWRATFAVVMCWQQCQRLQHRSDGASTPSAWSPGIHPQIE